MATFVIAYSLVWLALALYVARLGFRQHQLTQRAAALDDAPNQTAKKTKRCTKMAA